MATRVGTFEDVVNEFNAPTPAMPRQFAGSFLPDNEGGGAGLNFRMRATDTGLGQVVYWFSSAVDATGTDYAGPGPLTNIVVQNVLGD